MGVCRKGEWVNFALYSAHAQEVWLCLYLPSASEPFIEAPLNKSKNVWHVALAHLPAIFEYAYRLDGPNIPEEGLLYDKKQTLLDPYAISVNTSSTWGAKQRAYTNKNVRGRVFPLPPFDWEDDRPPKIPWRNLILYEMHVRAFTQDPSSKTEHPGTFAAVIQKIGHLKKLGVNAVELLPIFEFNENEYGKINPLTKRRLCNFWGYSPINFFSLMNRYGTSNMWHAAILDFKKMVKALHKEGIEVLLDVVYNHTAEWDEEGPSLSYRGIDNLSYYILDEKGLPKNYSGCGNTFNCNHPMCVQLIVDSLRYWVQQMHVDGFRFDLASILTRDPNGKPLEHPPLIQAINQDPLLSKVKLIAEPWDCAPLYQVGSFPGKGKWAEWNGTYRDIVRRFIKGTDKEAGPFARVLSGSEHLYKKNKHPYCSVNFITSHDGYTLLDLVSYQEKHNIANGENNKDGSNVNESWNCGAEGTTNNAHILMLRERQIRNFHLALMVSLGVPMVLMGDEYRHTRGGNNNAWCQDNELNWVQWNQIPQNAAFIRFFSLCIQLRKKYPLLRRASFLKPSDIVWHGHLPKKPNWGAESRFVAYSLKNRDKKEALYIAFNAHFLEASIILPPLPKNRAWHRVIDTSLPSPHDFVEDPASLPPLQSPYILPCYSAFVATAQKT